MSPVVRRCPCDRIIADGADAGLCYSLNPLMRSGSSVAAESINFLQDIGLQSV